MNLSLTSILVSKPTFIVEKYMALFKNHITHPKGGGQLQMQGLAQGQGGSRGGKYRRPGHKILNIFVISLIQ